jgi:hypothetical protein
LNLALPERGSVIRYAYLWAEEHRRGREEARKDRPAVVVALSVRRDGGQTEVLVLAVTRTPPANPSEAVALPPAIKRRLKLDEVASWIVTAEANAFIWPGPDIRPIPNRNPPSVVYGKIPEDLLQMVARSFLANRKRQQAEFVPRTN